MVTRTVICPPTGTVTVVLLTVIDASAVINCCGQQDA